MSIQVSIIVPCYNQAHFLSDSLQSVLNQTYTNWECIIVNDGSPDNTKTVAKQWCQKDQRFKYVEKSNGGLSSARNAGISTAKGSFILPLDADDIIHETFLEVLVPELEKDSNLAVVSCYSNFFTDNITNVVYQKKPIGTTYHALLFENIMMATSLYRKSSWETVGGYDEQMKTGFEDWEFWISITKSGMEFKFVEQFLFYYRRTINSMLTDTLQNHRMTTMQYVFKKHKELYKKHFDNTLDYLFFLSTLYKKSENKTKASLEYKMGSFILKPFKLIKKLVSK